MQTALQTLQLAILLSLGVGCGDKDTGEAAPATSGPFAIPDGLTPSTSTVCEGAEPILDGSGLYSGFQRCPDGTAHRVEPGAVDPNWDHETCAGTEDDLSCTADADCTDHSYGRCASLSMEPDGSMCACRYSCSVDGDCSPGQVCMAAEVPGAGLDYARCVAATCEGSGDCDSGECGASAFNDGCSVSLDVVCRTDADDCRLDAECLPDSGKTWEAPSCALGSEDAWTCLTPDCSPGRPLMVGGAPRTASQRARTDWLADCAPATDHLSAAERAVLAKTWRRIGALEHASVASFARFTLQLLGLGAPPELLRDAQAAAADEVEHARLAFALASAYGGEPVGPGGLALDGVMPRLEPSAVVRALVIEGCLGETQGAAEARVGAQHATDPVVAAVLLQIAGDETRHAALAWRTLRWMLQTWPSLIPVAQEALDAPMPQPEVGPDLSAHGLLSAAARRALHADLRRLVLPGLMASALPAGQVSAQR